LRRSDPGPAAGTERIIGIDPGLASTGWGLVDRRQGRLLHVGHGCIRTGAGQPPAERLLAIMRAVRELLDEYVPARAAVEILYFGKNVSSGIPVAQARGVVFATLAERGIPVAEFRPNAIKQGVCGVASADKAQVQQMVRILLGLAEPPESDHAADALAAAICAANSSGISLP